MDVRCERCRAQYAFDEEQITPAGVTVQCNACGHVFRVKKKELVVTLPVKPGELDEKPMQASDAAQRQPAPRLEAPSSWTIRQASGKTLTFTELNTLQRWIVERKVSRDDEITQGDSDWVRLGTLAELQSFFEVVEAADRPRERSTARYPAAPYPSPRAPAPAFPPPPPHASPPPPAPPPSQARPPAPPLAQPVSIHVDLDEADLRGAGQPKRPRNALVVALLLLVAGAGLAYVFAPALFAREAKPAGPPPPPPPPPPAPRPEPVAVPLTITMRPPEPPPPAPEPVSEPPVARSPEPTPEVKPKPKPPTVKQRLAEARRLREGNRAEQALDLYGRIAADDPENAEALAGRGLCYFDLEQYAPAEASLQEALRISPTQPDALLGLAETYRTQGRTAEAIAAFERYLAAHPEGDEAAVARNAINQLKE